LAGFGGLYRNWTNLFFPTKPFEQLDRFGKVAFWVRWWPAVLEKIKLSKKGDRWRVPMGWTPSHITMQLLSDPRIQGRTVTEERAKAVVVPLKGRAGDER
jgi:hypothetical protein